MQILDAYTESFCIITPGSFLYRRVLYKYMLARSPAITGRCSPHAFDKKAIYAEEK